MDTFLICSYPRSRTLWFSRFLSVYPQIWCVHDASEFASSSENYWRILEARYAMGAESVGSADTAAVLVLPALLAARPMTKVVWIDRPLEQVAESMRRAGFTFTQTGAEFLRSHKDRYRELFDLEIAFDSLKDRSMMLALWDFLFPEINFDSGVWEQLANRKIAYTAQDYAQRSHEPKKFLEFLANEGEAKCLGAQ